MKFICLSYMDEKVWDSMPKTEQEAMIEEWFTYDDVLRVSGHWLDGGQALQSVRAAKTLRRRGGKVMVTDGPYAETKEQLGGIGVLEARNLDEAVALMSKHPCARFGSVLEIRPVDAELDERCAPEATSEVAVEGAKIACLGFGDESRADREREAMIEECIAYHEVLRKYGQDVGGVALQCSSTAKTIRARGGKVMVTDGPYAETKEQLGGVATLRFRNMDEAVEAWRNHPCLRFGDVLELRPVDEPFDALIAARFSALAGKT
jgi:hypothetical protein